MKGIETKASRAPRSGSHPPPEKGEQRSLSGQHKGGKGEKRGLTGKLKSEKAEPEKFEPWNQVLRGSFNSIKVRRLCRARGRHSACTGLKAGMVCWWLKQGKPVHANTPSTVLCRSAKGGDEVGSRLAVGCLLEVAASWNFFIIFCCVAFCIKCHMLLSMP